MLRKIPVLFMMVIFICLQAWGQQKQQDAFLSITPIKKPAGASATYKHTLDNHAGDTSYLIIRNISIYGNKRTRRAIVLRELNLYPGDTMYASTQDAFLEEKRQRLLNSSLFLTVNIYPVNRGLHHTDLNIEVLERQYFLILPLLSLADRNFNVWWVKHNHDLDRLNYGLTLYETNLTGNKDRLGASFTLGYTQQFTLSYDFPYFDKAYRQGFGISASFSRNRELNYAIDSNKQVFYNKDDFIKKTFNFTINYSYKKEIRLKHEVALSYNSYQVTDTVLKLNPDFFPNNNPSQRYLALNYHFSYIGTDIWAYPLHGYRIDASLSRKGFGLLGEVNETKFTVKASKYWQLFPNTYGATRFTGSVRLPKHQPYFLFEGMGYKGQYLRGLEYYVANGNYFGFLYNTLKKQVVAFRIHSRLLPKEFATIPIRMYFKIYGDIGYNHFSGPQHHSMFTNKFLYTYGLGLDIVTFYDAIFRIEYSINQLGEKGVFLHFESSF